MSDMKRRDFITLLGSTAVGWPLAARAQQAPKRFGYLASASNPDLQQALLGGLRDLGYVEGQSLAIEYRYRANSVGICGWKFALHRPGTRVPYLCFALAMISPNQGRTIYLDRSAS
jgi:hypothetical protein